MGYIGNQSAKVVHVNIDTFKGVVADSAALNAITGMSSGDMYKQTDNGHAYIYDGSQWVDMGNIEGPTGARGSGIASIIRTAGDGSEGTTDTYTITYDDTTTTTFDVNNGTAGSIDHIALTAGDGSSGSTDTYTAYADSAETQVLGTFDVYNGADGATTLGALTDVDLVTTPVEDGQSIIWNAGEGKWVPGYVAGTGAVVITPPSILTPADGTSNVVLGPTVTTSDYETGETFSGTHTSSVLEVATDSDFTTIVQTITGGLTSFTVAGLSDNTTYYLRAKYLSGDFSSAAGPTSTFTTLDILIDEPTVTVTGSPSEISRVAVLTGDTFSTINGTDTHASTSYRIVRTGDSVVVYENLNDTVNLTSFNVPEGYLESGVEYSFEMQYHGAQYGNSIFGSYVGTVANIYVNEPVLTVDGAPSDVGGSPTLSTSAFSTNIGSDTHASTTWVIKDNGVVVWSSEDDTVNLLSIVVPTGVLEESKDYTFEAYHTGSTFGASTADVVAGTTKISFSGEYGLQWNNTADTYTRLGTAASWTTGADFTNNETVQSLMRRCVLNTNGTVNYYLDVGNSNLKEGGGASNLTGADGNVMVEIPKFWVKYVNTTGAKEMWISTAPASGYVLHPAFIKNGVEVDYRYYRAYKGYVNGSTLISRSGVAAGRLQTINTFRTYAKANGTGWGLVDWHLLHAVQTLLFIEIGTLDSQAVLGNGNDTGSDYGMTTGGSNSIGNASSPNTNDDTWMSYRGIENFYADIFEWIDGINISERLVYTSNTQSTFASDVFSGAYTSTGVTLPLANGYISDMNFSTKGFIPTGATGSNSTYVTDYVYSNTGARVAAFGGHAGNGLQGGAAFLAAHYDSSAAHASVGAGLSF